MAAANPSWPRFTLAQSVGNVYDMGLKCTMEDPEMFILEAALRDPELLEASRARTRMARAAPAPTALWPDRGVV